MVTSLGSSTRMADVLVIGGGPAGIAAAARAAEAQRHVLLIDESPELGGQIWRHRAQGAVPPNARTWLSRVETSGAKMLRGTAVVDIHDEGDDFTVTAEHNGVPVVVRAHAIVLATGARERFLPFPGWTLPGVIGVGAAQALLKSGMSFTGKRVVISGSGPLLLPVAGSLREAGASVLLVAEQAAWRSVTRFASGLVRRPSTMLQALRYRAALRRTPYHFGQWVTAARGNGRVEEADITDGSSTRTIACDVLCAAFGLVPNTELAQLLGCTIERGSVVVDARQQTNRTNVFCAGEPTGIGGMDLALIEGQIAGLSAAGRDADALAARRNRLRSLAHAMERAFAPREELRALAMPDTIVCRCEDVRLGAIDRNWTMRKAKLYTRAGMGPCQGRVCGAALQFLHGWPPDTVRLPAEPALFSTLTAESATTSSSANQGA
jgi:NADPH-dependent 2,4-dienoyl-CoA reductase/sulfur reductase-like enzyme